MQMSTSNDFCWLKKELEPGECPFILPEEVEFLKNQELRVRARCVECKKFYDDILSLDLSDKDEVTRTLKIAFEELARRNRENIKLNRLLTVHSRRFQVYHEVLAALQSAKTLREAAYILLVAITCREGAAFNRAFLLLYDHETSMFKGYFAIGPRDADEASRIWQHPEARTLKILISRFSDELFEKERAKFANILENLIIPYETETIGNIVSSKRAIRIKQPARGVLRMISELIGTQEYALSPLTSGDKPVGLIIADNFITGQPIEEESLEFLEVMSYQGSIAIERALYYEELQRNLEEVHRLNTALREYHKEVMRMEKMAAVGEIVHQITHDFKNPLTVIGGLAKVILESTDESFPYYRQLVAIKEEADRLMKMLNSTLQALRKKFSLERDWWNLNDLITKKVEEIKPILPAGIEIETDLDPDLPPVFIDLAQFENCLDNLITNAIEAMPNGGKIILRTVWDPPNVIFSVSDTGVGIKEKHKERIFDAFFTTKKNGIGLGLYNCREIVRSHGGEIEVFSEEGKGTTFVIKLKGGDVNERRTEETKDSVRG